MRRRPYLPVNHIPRFQGLVYFLFSGGAEGNYPRQLFGIETAKIKKASDTFVLITASLLNCHIPYQPMGQQSSHHSM